MASADEKRFNAVLDAVNPGNTINVKIANTPNPTKIGDDVFSEKTFLNNSFIFFSDLNLYINWCLISNIRTENVKIQIFHGLFKVHPMFID